MNVFAVVALNDLTSPNIKNAVVTAFAENNLEVGKMAWIVADSGTTLSVAKQLGIPDNPEMSGVLVVNFTSYYGRASANVWEWIKTKLEAAPK
jgi:uncharacterized protein (DUF362 family)